MTGRMVCDMLFMGRNFVSGLFQSPRFFQQSPLFVELYPTLSNSEAQRLSLTVRQGTQIG